MLGEKCKTCITEGMVYGQRSLKMSMLRQKGVNSRTIHKMKNGATGIKDASNNVYQNNNHRP